MAEKGPTALCLLFVCFGSISLVPRGVDYNITLLVNNLSGNGPFCMEKSAKGGRVLRFKTKTK